MRLTKFFNTLASFIETDKYLNFLLKNIQNKLVSNKIFVEQNYLPAKIQSRDLSLFLRDEISTSDYSKVSILKQNCLPDYLTFDILSFLKFIFL